MTNIRDVWWGGGTYNNLKINKAATGSVMEVKAERTDGSRDKGAVITLMDK